MMNGQKQPGTVGRPTIDLEDTVTKLTPYLRLGYSIRKSCAFAGIPHDAVYKHFESNAEFHTKITLLQNWISIKARENLQTSIVSPDPVLFNPDNARWWLERKDRDDFATKQISESDVNIGDRDKLHEILDQISEPDEKPESTDEPNTENPQSV